MANSSDSFSTALARALGVDEKSIADKLSGMSIEQMNNLVNAMSDGNDGAIKGIVGKAASKSPDDVHPLMATEAPPKAAPAKPAAQPAQAKAPAPAASQTDQEEPEMAESVEDQFGVGDTLLLDDEHEVMVKTPRGPQGTVGCMIDGQQRMVKKNRLKRVSESVLGQADLAALLRMQVLAGMTPSRQTMPVQTAKVRTTDVPAAPVTQGRSIATPTSFQLPMDPDDEMANIEGAFADIVSRLPGAGVVQDDPAPIVPVAPKPTVVAKKVFVEPKFTPTPKVIIAPPGTLDFLKGLSESAREGPLSSSEQKELRRLRAKDSRTPEQSKRMLELKKRLR